MTVDDMKKFLADKAGSRKMYIYHEGLDDQKELEVSFIALGLEHLKVEKEEQKELF